MVVNIKSLPTVRKLLPAISLLAALSFNNWILGPLLNYRLFAANG